MFQISLLFDLLRRFGLKQDRRAEETKGMSEKTQSNIKSTQRTQRTQSAFFAFVSSVDRDGMQRAAALTSLLSSRASSSGCKENLFFAASRARPAACARCTVRRSSAPCARTCMPVGVARTQTDAH